MALVTAIIRARRTGGFQVSASRYVDGVFGITVLDADGIGGFVFQGSFAELAQLATRMMAAAGKLPDLEPGDNARAMAGEVGEHTSQHQPST